MQGRRLEFSPVGIEEANVPVFSMAITSPIRSSDGLSTQRHVDVSMSLLDSSTKLQLVEDSRVVGADNVGAIKAVVTADCSDSLEEGFVIGDLYVSCCNVAPLREAVGPSSGTNACMESSSCVIGDLGITTESTDVGVCFGNIDSQFGIESCVQSQVTTIEALSNDGDIDTPLMIHLMML